MNEQKRKKRYSNYLSDPNWKLPRQTKSSRIKANIYNNIETAEERTSMMMYPPSSQQQHSHDVMSSSLQNEITTPSDVYSAEGDIISTK